MNMKTTLKQAIRDCGLSDQRLGKLAGVNRLSLRRFLNGETSLSLEAAERLAEFFGLELRPTDRPKSKKGPK